MLRFLLFIAILSINLFASDRLFVETLDEQYYSKNLLSLRFRINNELYPIKDAVLKYCLVKEPGKEIAVERYYPRDAQVDIREVDSIHACIDYVLDSVPEGLFPNESGYSLGIRYENWLNRDKYRDFSMPKSSVFSLANNVALYAGGKRIWGNVPEWAENAEFLPDAHPYALPDGVKVILEDGQPMRFVWNYVLGADLYRLTVLSSEDSSIVYQNTYATNAADVELASGDYLWTVQTSNSEKEFKPSPAPHTTLPKVSEGEVEGSLLSLLRIFIQQSNDGKTYVENVRIGAPFDTIAASNGRKDTRLLNISWGELADIRGWDTIHSPPDIVTRPLDEDEGNRCWAIAIQELNHYYTTKDGEHGNLTLDEIVLKVKIHTDSMKARENQKGPALAAFELGDDAKGNPWTENPFGLSYALNIDMPEYIDPSILGWSDSMLVAEWRDLLRQDRPIYVDARGHVMVVDGFRTDSSGVTEFHFINTDNYGTCEWRDYTKSGIVSSIRAYYEFDIPKDVRLTDPDVHRDTDEDGIMDFDEKYRFDSFFDSPDSDGDSIDDKTEIHSYVVREMTRRNPNGLVFGGVIKERLADSDGDRKRAENDDDSDDDGVKDGEEDVNHNGYVDEGETDPYFVDVWYPASGNVEKSEIPQNIALYALDYIRMNDGDTCVQAKAGCSIASEQVSESAVVLGTNVHVDKIFSRGRVWLRSGAKVSTIRYYGMPTHSYETDVQNGAFCEQMYNLNARIWPWKIPEILPMSNGSLYDKVVKAGESYTVQDGDSFRSLKVEAGGKLYFSSGIVVTDDLQFDAMSEIYFNNPEYGTIVHVNKNIKWNGAMKKMNGIQSDITFASDISQCFKLYYHGTEAFDVAGLWRGTIVAPKAKIILGQGQYKLIYGQFLAKQIVVHQHSKIVKQEFIKPVNQPAVHQEVALGRIEL